MLADKISDGNAVKKRMTNGRAANKISSCCLYCSLEDKREDYQNCSVAPVLCTTVVHNDTQTCEQFLKLSVGFWRSFLNRFTLCYRTVLSVTLVYCGQMVGWITMKLGMFVGMAPPHCVRWGPSSPQKKEAHPQFLTRLLWPNGWMDYDDAT